MGNERQQSQSKERPEANRVDRTTAFEFGKVKLKKRNMKRIFVAKKKKKSSEVSYLELVGELGDICIIL